MDSIANLTSTLDLSRLVLAHALLGTLVAASPRVTSYNLPIALFGLYVIDRASSEGLRQFGSLHALSFILDIYWMLSGSDETGRTVTFLLLVNMFLKPVTLLALSSNLKQQGLPTMGSIGPTSMPGSLPSSNGAFDDDPSAGRYDGHGRGTTVWSIDERPVSYQSTPYHTRDFDGIHRQTGEGDYEEQDDVEEDLTQSSAGYGGPAQSAGRSPKKLNTNVSPQKLHGTVTGAAYGGHHNKNSSSLGSITRNINSTANGGYQTIG